MSGRFPTQPRLECGVTVEVTRQSTPVHGSCRLLPSGATKPVTPTSAVPYERRACETPVRDLAIKVILLHV